MKRWNVDRVKVFFLIVVVSFLYDLTFYLGIRDTARFPHPFVYFRSLGDVELLRGFPWMLRQVMFSLVAGGLLGWIASLIILKSDWLTRASIRFLRIALWFPFLVVFAALPQTIAFGIAAAMLAAVYHFLTARSTLEFSNGAACHYAAGEVTLQCLFFNLIAQVWMRGWEWAIAEQSNTTTGFITFALILSLVFFINWTFGRSFAAVCTTRSIQHNKECLISQGSSFLGVALLTVIWLLLWQLICAALLNDSAGPFPAIQRAIELVIGREVRRDINISLFEVGGGLFFGGLFAFATSTAMNSSEKIERAIAKTLPFTHLSLIALWPVVFFYVLPTSGSTSWYRSFFSIGIGGKMILVGFLTFFAFIQTLWAFREVNLSQRLLIAIHDALPIAFVAMCFSELYGATAGLGFQMVVAGSTFNFQESLAWFLITVVLLSVLSGVVSFLAWHPRYGRLPSAPVEGEIARTKLSARINSRIRFRRRPFLDSGG